MSRRDLATDLAIAVVVATVSLGLVAAGGLEEPSPTSRDLDPLGVALLLAATLPLAARRLAPVTVFAAVSAATLAVWVFGYRMDIPFGPLIGVFTLGLTYGGAPPARRLGGMLAVAALVPATTLIYLWDGYDLRGIVAPDMTLWVLGLIALWIAGDRVRLRRERMAELSERVRRAEREAERERRVTAAEERLRIARELHDSAGHAINVILVQAGAARLLHERDPAASRQAIATIEQVARDTIGEIDRLVRALRADGSDQPVPADPGAIEELVQRHRAGGLEVTSEVRGTRRTVPRSVAWAAYRILQEALTNAARHGRGSARVAVEFGVDAVELAVTNPAAPHNGASGDNGAGGDNGVNGGHGIVGMRERATLLGGTLETVQRDSVFQLFARLPYPGGAVR